MRPFGALLVTSLALAGSVRAVPIFSPAFNGVPDGKALTTVASSADGRWILVGQELGGQKPAVIVGTGTDGVRELLLDGSRGWVSVGVPDAAGPDGEFSATAREGDQNWIFSRWDGRWAGFYPRSAVYLRLIGQRHWSAGVFEEGNPREFASGQVPLADEHRLSLRSVGASHRAAIDGAEMAAFESGCCPQAGLGLVESAHGLGRFRGLVMDDGVPTPTFTASPSRTRTPVLSATPTATLSPSFTPSPSASASPTVTYTPGPTDVWEGKSYPVEWTMMDEPVLRPDPAKDYGNTYFQEPSVLLGLDGLYHMVYSGGIVEREDLFVATSKDGYTWERHGPAILGHGAGGYKGGTARGRQILVNGTYYVFYFGDTHLRFASSKDGFTYEDQGIALDNQQFTREGLCDYPLPYDSLAVLPNPAGGFFGLLCSPREGSCLPWNGNKWNEWLFKSDGDFTKWSLAHKAPLDSILDTSGDPRGLYCMRQMHYVNGHWQAWPFINYPSNIWHSVSDDAVHWRTDPVPVLQYKRHMYGMKDCNQVADPDVIEINGKLHIYFSAFDNHYTEGLICLAVWPGTLDEYDRSHYAPAPSPTPSPTPEKKPRKRR